MHTKHCASLDLAVAQKTACSRPREKGLQSNGGKIYTLAILAEKLALIAKKHTLFLPRCAGNSAI